MPVLFEIIFLQYEVTTWRLCDHLVSGFVAINGCRSYDCVFVIEVDLGHAYAFCGGEYYVQEAASIAQSV